MADDETPDEIPWFAPGHRHAAIPAQRQPGEEVWRLRDPEGVHVQTCELRDDSKDGKGWNVMILQDGEPLLSRRCIDERGARYVAESFRKDTVKAGWILAQA